MKAKSKIKLTKEQKELIEKDKKIRYIGEELLKKDDRIRDLKMYNDALVGRAHELYAKLEKILDIVQSETVKKLSDTTTINDRDENEP